MADSSGTGVYPLKPDGISRVDDAFPPTHWSAVLEAAGHESSAEKARRAFEQICGDYRNAIVHWMRLHRLTPHEAEDAAHDFLEQWLQRENPLKGFERQERRFRDFLHVCLRRFLGDWIAAKEAGKRGGGVPHLQVDACELSAPDTESVASLDFALAVQIHANVLTQLQPKWEKLASLQAFERIQKTALGDNNNPGYATLARELEATVGTLKSWIFRFRREYHDAFRDAVSRHSNPSQLDGDVVYLHSLLLNPPVSV